jgi:hypothetical protein
MSYSDYKKEMKALTFLAIGLSALFIGIVIAIILC